MSPKIANELVSKTRAAVEALGIKPIRVACEPVKVASSYFRLWVVFKRDNQRVSFGSRMFSAEDAPTGRHSHRHHLVEDMVYDVRKWLRSNP